jgi:predicted kinase
MSRTQGGASDCPHPLICVTSLNMRKWMRERLQRRKQKQAEKPDQPATPPLQPAYFDAGENAEPEAQPGQPEPSSESDAAEAAIDAAPEPAAEGSQPSTSPSGGAAPQRGRSRRRRGGRGRGGRGREKAVAQAFVPAATKGAVSESAGETAEETQPEIEPETEPVSPAVQAVPVAPALPTAPARPPKGIVVLAIGLPGSGKSTWFKRHNVTPLSSDMVRSLLFDDIREQRFQDLVFSNLRSMLKARLIARRPMNYVDATNLTPKEREHWIKLAKGYNYEVHAVFFDVPLEVCLERHQRRDRVVPEDVLRRMAAKLKPPTFDEGFAKITVVRVKKKSEATPSE